MVRSSVAHRRAVQGLGACLRAEFFQLVDTCIPAAAEAGGIPRRQLECGALLIDMLQDAADHFLGFGHELNLAADLGLPALAQDVGYDRAALDRVLDPDYDV